MGRVRHWIRVVHRDAGYFLAGLVVIFSISGVAVNHIESWNPSYSRSEEAVSLGPLDASSLDTLERDLVARLALDPDDVRGRRLESPSSFKVFLDEGGEASVDPGTGEGTLLRVRRRPVLFESNVLHLNHIKGSWTFVSDAFAILLAGLAVTGLFMLRGRAGLAGRGKWFVAGGLIVPAAFLAHYYATR